MNENLDLTEVLKDCPKGTKFYSSYLGRDVFFIGIHNNYIECEYPSKIDSPFNSTIQFRKEGSFFEEGECMFFPSKDQRDWSKWHRPFKDGDVVTYKLKGSLVAFIYKERTTTTLVKSHFALYIHNMGFCIDGDIALKEEDIVFATEEEKQRLFDFIRANGYKWNAETKTLEKSIVPKFKVGDSIQSKTDNNDKFTITNIDNNKFYYGCGKGHEFMIPVVKQDNWELVPNKFDPKTLKPFDKVLVRDNSENNWRATFFSHLNDLNLFYYKFVTTGGTGYKQMIPYNDNTKHLVGTNNKEPLYYKCWED